MYMIKLSDKFWLRISSRIKGPDSDVLLFSSIVEYRVVVHTCGFLNRIANFEKLKNNNKYQNTISPKDGLQSQQKANGPCMK